jgi:hypothetical protein
MNRAFYLVLNMTLDISWRLPLDPNLNITFNEVDITRKGDDDELLILCLCLYRWISVDKQEG